MLARTMYALKYFIVEKPKNLQIPSIPVANLSEDIVQVIKGHLASHDINPVQPNLQTACPESPQSLLVDNKLAHFPDSEVVYLYFSLLVVCVYTL